MQPENKSPARLSPETPETPVTSPVAHDLLPRRFKNYILSERELSTLGFMSAFGTLVVTFFGITGGAAVALWVTLKTVPIADPNTFAAFWAAFLVSLIFSILLGGASVLLCVMSWRDVRSIKLESEQEKRARELLRS